MTTRDSRRPPGSCCRRTGSTSWPSPPAASEAMRLARELRPDLALVDIDLGGESGLDVACRLRADEPGALADAVILISTHAAGRVRRVDRGESGRRLYRQGRAERGCDRRRSSPAPRRSGPSDLASARGRACPQLEGVSDRRRRRGIRHRRGRVRRDGGGGAAARGDRARRSLVRAVRRRGRRRGVATRPSVRRSVGAGRRRRDRFLLHRAVSNVRLSGLGELPRDRDVHRDRRPRRRDPRGDPAPRGDFGDRARASWPRSRRRCGAWPR